MNKKRIIVITGSAIVIVCLIIGIIALTVKGGSNSRADQDVAYVNSVAAITNAGGAGIDNRYSGAVEAQQEWKINLDTEKKVKEIFVEVGQEVAEGTDLFTYDMAEIEEKINQGNLELERINNEITDKNKELKNVEKEKKSAASSEQIAYNTQIQTIKTEIKQKEYERQSKQVEIEQLNSTKESSTVKSQIAGVVKAINDGNQNDEMMYGGESDNSFMTILATGDFQIKGMANEQNVGMLNEGDPMIIRSRIDESVTWNGTIEKIDTDNPDSNKSINSFYDGSDSGETSISYPFYLKLESAEGLMLGQHVYVEIDMGQGKERDGIWLAEDYIVIEEEDSYVWADNGKEKLEKRKVVLGDYDEELMQYEVKEGLSLEDYIAFPSEELKAGMKTQIGEPVIDDEMWDEEDYIPEEDPDMMMEGEDGMPDPDMMPEDDMPEDDSLEDDMPEDPQEAGEDE